MDPVANWCAAVALSHCLKGNPTQKEQLLRVQLATSLGNPPVSLLQQCTNILAQVLKCILVRIYVFYVTTTAVYKHTVCTGIKIYFS